MEGASYAARVPLAGGQGQQVSALHTHLQGSAASSVHCPPWPGSHRADSVTRKVQAFRKQPATMREVATKGTLKCISFVL